MALSTPKNRFSILITILFSLVFEMIFILLSLFDVLILWLTCPHLCHFYKLQKVILCIYPYFICLWWSNLNLIIANIYIIRSIISVFTKQFHMCKIIWTLQQPCEVLLSLNGEIGSKELNNSVQANKYNILKYSI